MPEATSKVRITIEDSIMISMVMSEVLLRYSWMDKRLSVLEKECEKKREKTEIVKELYAKRM